jgi:hypothetical protein
MPGAGIAAGAIAAVPFTPASDDIAFYEHYEHSPVSLPYPDPLEKEKNSRTMQKWTKIMGLKTRERCCALS